MNSNLRRWMALVVVCFGQLMIMLDTTIVNVALPYIQRDLDFTQANLTWVVNAYLVAYGGFLLVAGRIGDLIGRRKVFLAGVFLFTVASVGSGLAGSADHLIVGRFLQGVGASLSAGVIIAIIVTEFQKPAERAQAMSVFTLVIAGGGSLGLLAGGFLTQWVNWHWIFYINLPIGILTMVLGSWLIRENEGLGMSQGVDVVGAVLITAALMLGVYGIVTAADTGWTSTHTLGFGGAAIGLAALFILLESRIANPLMPLRILGIRSLTGASAARSFLFTGLFTNFFMGALYLQHIRGYSAFETGLAFLPTTLMIGVMSAGLAARMMARVRGQGPVQCSGFHPRQCRPGQRLRAFVPDRLCPARRRWRDVLPAPAHDLDVGGPDGRRGVGVRVQQRPDAGRRCLGAGGDRNHLDELLAGVCRVPAGLRAGGDIGCSRPRCGAGGAARARRAGCQSPRRAGGGRGSGLRSPGVEATRRRLRRRVEVPVTAPRGAVKLPARSARDLWRGHGGLLHVVLRPLPRKRFLHSCERISQSSG